MVDRVTIMVPTRPVSTAISDVVGRNVQRLREQYNWSQDRLAALCRVTRRVIRDIEYSRPDGTRRPISVDELYALAEALRVAPVALLPPPKGTTAQPHPDGLKTLVADAVNDALERFQKGG
jgi:transcriptional regulator with XRE-family HTH domain